MLYCVENTTTFNYEDPLAKRDKTIVYEMPTIIDANILPEGSSPNGATNNLEYNKFGNMHEDI